MALSSSNVSKVSVKRTGCDLGVLMISLCAATSGWAEETASSPSAWTELRAKIEEREKSVKSFEVRFEERWVDTKRDPQVSDKVGRWIVQMKGDQQIRVEEDREHLSPIDKKPYLSKRINVTNGGVYKTFYPKLGNLYPGGYICKEDDIHFYDHCTLMPLAVGFRMLEWMAADCPALSPDKISVRTGTINGKACVIASWTFQRKPVAVICKSGDCKPPSPPVIAREVYLDATREMVPLRVTATVIGSRLIGSTHLQWDLQYSTDAAGFVLSGWKFVSSNAEGDVVSASTAKVLQWNVNPKIDDSKFDIQFPVGTYVEDRVAGENYILKENARKRLVTAKDWSGATYETLLHTEPSSN
jgi:hypothetical protein